MQTEKADSDTIGEGQDFVEKYPDLVQKLIDAVENGEPAEVLED